MEPGRVLGIRGPLLPTKMEPGRMLGIRGPFLPTKMEPGRVLGIRGHSFLPRWNLGVCWVYVASGQQWGGGRTHRLILHPPLPQPD